MPISTMNPLRFIREHIWSMLPEVITDKQRLWAAVLWGDLLLGFGLWRGWDALAAGRPPGAAALALVVGGFALQVLLLIPPVGRAIYRAILRVFSIVGFVLSSILLTVFFYLVVTPMGLGLRLMGKDLLDRAGPPAWKPHTGRTDRRRYYRLF